MKKLRIALSVLLLSVCLGLVVYTGLHLFNTHKAYRENIAAVERIDAIAPARVVVEHRWQNQMPEEQNNEQRQQEADPHTNAFATYQYKNIAFVSHSEQWDEAKLEALCQELLKNKHGREIDYLELVEIWGQRDEDMAGYQQAFERSIEIPLYNYRTLPLSFAAKMSNPVSDIVLYNGDVDNTVESMARTLSHEYGHHFTFFYFGLDQETVRASEYYKLRCIDDARIRIEREGFDEYIKNHQWYLIEIAAEDYQYLMGSPATYSTERFYDAKENLSISVKGKSDAQEKMRVYKDCFNLEPHENVALPLPDQVEGLADLFYSAIGIEAPSYQSRQQEADAIKIKFGRREEYGHQYYSISWDKPWSSRDVTYTLTAYDASDKLLGGVKSIKGNERAKAYIGETVLLNSSKTTLYWWPGYWTDYDFVRFRVVVTFPDGTAAISPPVDRKF